MNKEDFVTLIKKYIRDPAVKSNFKAIVRPPGSSPEQELVKISEWYNSLSELDKAMVIRVAEMTLDQGIFDFLCVLDEVLIIDERLKKGKLLLVFRENDKEFVINDKEKDLEELHDIYMSLIRGE
jgi:hypothetical protein